MSEAFVQMDDGQLGRLSLIEAIRANTDAVKRLGDQKDRQDHKLDEIGKALGEINTRLAVLEQSSLHAQVEHHQREMDRLEARLRVLENLSEQRKGAMNLFEWVGKNWPAVIGFVGIVALLIKQWGWV